MSTSHKKVSVQVPVIVFQEHDIYVAYCPALEVSSYGDTEEEAKDAFDGAMSIFLKETTRKGTLERYLLKLGWQLQQQPTAYYRPPAFSATEGEKLLQKNGNIYNELVAMPV